MNEQRSVLPIIWFLLKFLVLAAALVVVWWSLLPWYGYLLGQLAGGLARFVLGVPIVALRLEAQGLLNTDSMLAFDILTPDGASHITRKLEIALLVTNMVPYLALVLATSGIALARRVRILLIGAAILMAGHIFFLTLPLRYQEFLQRHSEIPTSITQFFLILPVLLWLGLAFRDKIAAYLADEEKPQS